MVFTSSLDDDDEKEVASNDAGSFINLLENILIMFLSEMLVLLNDIETGFFEMFEDEKDDGSQGEIK